MTEKQTNSIELQVESLEERQMLSTVDVFAAGVTNEETIELQIDGAVVQTWSNIGGNVDASQFIQFTYTTDQTIDPGQIRVGFTNNLYQPEAGIGHPLMASDSYLILWLS